jgi:DNA-binding transcriptional ArsR family regulator
MSRTTATKADDRLDAVFGALADPTRRRMLVRLSRGEASITELAEPFDMTLPAVSKHLRVLERAGLVRRERDGWYHRCHLEARSLGEAASFLERWRPFWDRTLDQLARYVESAQRGLKER